MAEFVLHEQCEFRGSQGFHECHDARILRIVLLSGYYARILLGCVGVGCLDGYRACDIRLLCALLDLGILFGVGFGLAIGIVIGLWVWLSQAIGFGPTLFGAGLALLPIAVSGGIHMDGFCDVVDAQSSHAEPTRKREILKDPHSGAFAAIAVAAYIVAYAAVASELVAGWRIVVLLAGMHIASRCMSGIATVVFPTSSSKGMLSMFHESARGKRILIVLVIELVVCGVVMTATCVPAIFVLLVGLVCLGLLYPFAQSQFGGMSGDLAGFFLQVAELAMIVALVVISKVVVL